MPDGLSAQTALADQLKKKKLFDVMTNSINAPQPMAGGVNLPAGNAPIESVPSGLPSGPFRQPEPPPIRIHIGANTGGLQGVDKSLAELRTQEQAAKDYPSSKVVDGEIKAPKMHHGLGDKLKSLGKGLVINMGEYARTHPGAETGELLGAGGAGAAVGAISPVSIDALQRQGEIRQKQGEVAGEIGLEGEQAQLENARNKPVLEAERVRMEQQKSADAAMREDERLRETARHNQETESERRNRPRAERAPLIRTRKRADGSEVSLQSDDNGKTWEEIPELTDEAKAGTDNSELVRNLDKRIGEYSSKAQDLRQQAEVLKATANTDYTAGEDRQRLLKAADDADKEAASLRGERDKEAAKTKLPANATPSPSTHILSKKDWLKSHPEKDWPKAIAAAKAGGYQIMQ